MAECETFMKALRIKTGVVRRLTKDKWKYEEEVEEQKVRIEKCKEQGKDEYCIRKEHEVLKECLMMVPYSQKALLVAFGELKTLLENSAGLAGSEAHAAAERALAEAEAHLPKGAYYYR